MMLNRRRALLLAVFALVAWGSAPARAKGVQERCCLPAHEDPPRLRPSADEAGCLGGNFGVAKPGKCSIYGKKGNECEEKAGLTAVILHFWILKWEDGKCRVTVSKSTQDVVQTGVETCDDNCDEAPPAPSPAIDSKGLSRAK